MVFDIDVSPDLIEAGTRSCPWGCTLALAISRATGLLAEEGDMDVDGDGLYVRGQRDFRRASKRLPEVARRFIDDSDAGRPVHPFRFRLAIFNWCLPGS